MKKQFPGFYSPSEKEIDVAWNDAQTLFVFDTNTLLNLYGYASQTRDDFFSIMDLITKRIWIPYHVGLEYQRRRLSVVRDEKAIFTKTENLLLKVSKVFDNEFSDLALNRRFPALYDKTEKLHIDIKKLFSAYRKSLTHWDKKQPCVRGHDEIREKINNLFDKKVGDMPESQEWLNKIFEEGKVRYENNVPPGYKDTNKANKEKNSFCYSGLEYKKEFGDLLIWKQLIDKASDTKIKSVIFVTDDAKDDWWYTIDSRGKKSIGPRAELREEICKEANINLFTMYNTSSFLQNGKKLLSVEIKDESISDADTAFTKQANKNTFLSSSYINKIKELQKLGLSPNILQNAEKFKTVHNLMKHSPALEFQNKLNKSYAEIFKNYSNQNLALKKASEMNKSLFNFHNIDDYYESDDEGEYYAPDSSDYEEDNEDE